MRKEMKMKLAIVTTFLGLSLAMAGTAVAGRGGSPGAIRNAINSGSVDSISAAVERAEFLVCVACIDMVNPLVDNGNYKLR